MPHPTNPKEQAELNRIAGVRSAAARKANHAFIGIMECEIVLKRAELPADERNLAEVELELHTINLREAKAAHAATGKEWRPRTQARILRERRKKLGDARNSDKPRDATAEREWLKKNAREDLRTRNSLPPHLFGRDPHDPHTYFGDEDTKPASADDWA